MRSRKLQKMKQLLGRNDMVIMLEELDEMYLFNLDIYSVVLGFSHTWYVCLSSAASVRCSIYLTKTHFINCYCLI